MWYWPRIVLNGISPDPQNVSNRCILAAANPDYQTMGSTLSLQGAPFLAREVRDTTWPQRPEGDNRRGGCPCKQTNLPLNSSTLLSNWFQRRSS